MNKKTGKSYSNIKKERDLKNGFHAQFVNKRDGIFRNLKIIAGRMKRRIFSLHTRRKTIFPWIGLSVFLFLFFFYPLIRILWIGLNPSALKSIDLGSFDLAFHSLLFTFYQATLSTILTLILGIPAAFLFARYAFFGKRTLRILTAIPFVLPTVVVAAGFSALLGPHGWLNMILMKIFNLQAAPLTIVGTLVAILMAHVFYNSTIVIRMVGNALEHMDQRLEQAARSLGANPARILRQITIPLLKPSILASFLLVFIFDFTSFGVILLLGGPGFSTLEVEIYKQATQILNLPLAGLLSLIQLLCTLAFSILYSQVVRHISVTTSPHAASSNLRIPHSHFEKFFNKVMPLLLLVIFLLPLLSLPLSSLVRLEPDRGVRNQPLYGITGEYYTGLFVNQRESIFYVPPIKALVNSFVYATLTVLLSLALGFPVASALIHPNRFERLLDSFLMLPLGASAVTLGLGFIVTFNRPPLKLVTSPILVPIAHTLIALPFVIRSLQPALASIPERLRKAAASLGASPWQVWITVDWPIVTRATLSAAVFSFTISLGEFGASSLVVRPEYPTIPIAIARFLTQPGGMNYGQAMAMATILMLVCGSGIFLIEKLHLPGTSEF